jgi:uncharacterized protein (DUF362 family)
MAIRKDIEMDRRRFMKTSLGASAVLALGAYKKALAKQPQPPLFDLVAIRGGEAEVMFDRGMEALGGVKAFVKKGHKVVVKPNIGWDVSPERAGNTNPKLVAHIIKRCLEAGAKEVYVFDHTCDNWQRCYRTSGIEDAVKNAGGKIVPGGSESYYQEVTVTGGKTLSTAKEHELILSSDVFINVPILKGHSSARVTASMKNLMGVVWDREFWHSNDLHLCIAEYAAFRKPTLNVVDAYAVMKRNGPRGVSVSDVVMMKAQLISADMVAIDTAATKLFGLDPGQVRYIQIAAELGAGQKDLEKLNIKRIAI